MDIKRFAQDTYLYLILSALALNILISFVPIPYFGLNLGLISNVVTCLPPIIMLLIRRYPIKASLSFNLVSVSQLLFALALAICGTIVIIVLNKIISFPPYTRNLLVTSLVGFSLWPDILIWIVGAILIELVYRGIIQNGFQHLAPLKLCIIVSLLFVFPRSLFDIPSQILIGFAYALLTYKTGSVIPAIVAHFLVFALKQPLSCLVFNIGLMWGNMFTLIFLLLAAIGVSILLFAKMPGKTLKTYNVVCNKEKPRPAFIIAIVIVVICTLWLTGLDVYFMLII